ncbi:MAG: phosphoribosyl-ATP diphosphatase [Pseudomonadota bacterium]
MTAFTLADLEAIIADRASADGEASYTRSLMDKGVEKAAEKFGEEAVEAVIAAVAQDEAAVTGEAADVLYHMLVLLKLRDIPVADVMKELQRRTGQSGHAEKAARQR